MLSDHNVYLKLSSVPTSEFTCLLDNLLLEGIVLDILNNKQREHMLVKSPLCLVFHAFPKTHKNIFPPSFRTIISGVGSLMERMCIWLDYNPWYNATQVTLKTLRHYFKHLWIFNGIQTTCGSRATWSRCTPRFPTDKQSLLCLTI